MKIKLFATMFVLSASTVFAQGFNPYRIAPMKPNCYESPNPYNQYAGQPTRKCWMPSNTPPHVTYGIVQASIGMFEREHAFLILVNNTNETNTVNIEYVIDGKPGTFFQLIHLAPKERYPIGLHADPELTGQWNFSVLTKFEKSGLMEMVWYRASDNAEVANKIGQRIE